MERFKFNVEIEANDETGEIMAAYFRFRTGKTHQTKEFANGNAFADYDKSGKLIGLELLGPCQADVLEKIAKHAPAKRFLRNVVPGGMLVTS